MKCSDVRAALALMIYGEQGPQDAALREHLATCAECRREHE
ncbi:MAG: zf-HC2 domain-containing protein, partial [Gemmataceae bacterium]